MKAKKSPTVDVKRNMVGKFLLAYLGVVTTLALAFSVYIMRETLFRTTLSYSETGVFFDDTQGITYHEQALLPLTIISCIMVLFTLLSAYLLITRYRSFKR